MQDREGWSFLCLKGGRADQQRDLLCHCALTELCLVALGQQIFSFGEQRSCLVARRVKGSPKIFLMPLTPEVTLLSPLALLLRAGDDGCGMERASLSLCRASQGHRQTKIHSEALSALSVLSKGTGKCSSSDCQAQNSPRCSAIQQGQRRLCSPRTHCTTMAEAGGPSMAKAIIHTCPFPCSAPAPPFINPLPGTGLYLPLSCTLTDQCLHVTALQLQGWNST